MAGVYSNNEVSGSTQRARVERILSKLEAVRTRNLSCFGSNSHHFRLNPPLALNEIEEFEARHHIRLPEDYRAFLTEAGNGGAGPYYGIFPLSKWADFLDWVLDERPEDILSRTCPLRPTISRTENWADPFNDASPYQGTIAIGTQGCTYEVLLVVRGPLAGKVLYVDADGQPPYIVWEPDFLSWYERWLDELLAGYDQQWFGYGPGGGEADFLAYIYDPSSSDPVKEASLAAFCRLPTLSLLGASRIVALCQDPSPSLRAAACSVVTKFKIADGEIPASKLLADTSPEVRAAATKALMALNPSRWSDAVTGQLLVETDKNAASSMFFQLKGATTLPRAILLEIIARRVPGAYSLAVWMMKWETQDRDLLATLLCDSQTEVRRHAMLGLRSVGDSNSVRLIAKLLDTETDGNIIGCALLALGSWGGPNAVSILLEWSTSADDFHRLDAVNSLARLGELAAVPVITSMLQEHRSPVRRSEGGEISNVKTISALVRESIARSPNADFRRRIIR